MNPRLAIIGGGNMGAAFARGLLHTGVVKAQELLVIEPSSDRRLELQRELACQLSSEAGPSLTLTEAVIIAVKPQVFSECAAALQPISFGSSTLFLSLMAGVTLDTLRRELSSAQAVVRAMPNLPARLGLGVTGYFTDSDLTEAHQQLLISIVESVGVGLPLSSEELLDACTAVSGSGPGFLFALFEAFVSGAIKIGFTAEEAEMLVQRTVRGAVALWEESKQPLETLRNQVTSKGGTTEAGLSALRSGGAAGAIEAALEHAFARAREIAKGS